MLYGLLDLSFWGYVIATLLMTHLTIIGVTVYLHRHQAHRALELHPAVAHLFRAWLWLTTGMVTAEWVAIHRKHHARCETPEDPHSPRYAGIGTVLLRGSELYRAEAQNPETLARYRHGTPSDALERRLYSAYPFLGIGVMLVIDLLLFGVPGITVWAVQMLWIPVFAAGVINGLGHWWGYRNYETEDASTNIVPWGVLIGGEELHNNHHAYASSARLSNRPWELDIGWWYIRALEVVGLARVKKVPPRPLLVPGKVRLDPDTVKAIIGNRLQVMAQYARRVVGQVHREELEKARGGYRRGLKGARRLLVRGEAVMSEEARRRRDGILQDNQALRTVYEYRQRLQRLWGQRMASQENLVQALQEWCAQAEATGIRALEEFSRSLRSYTLRPA